MPLRLSDEQRKALGGMKDRPVYVVDPVTHARYVLLTEDDYQRARALFEHVTFDVAEMYPLMDEVAREEGWDDKEMDAYDALDPRRKP
jgi:hypothetical protein